jgi:hypothetical protein
MTINRRSAISDNFASWARKLEACRKFAVKLLGRAAVSDQHM